MTERELVPVLEKAWNFSWDKGHAQKFLLDMMTLGETWVAFLRDEPVGYVWYRVMRRRGFLRSRRLLWLNYLVLDQAAQNQGLGRRIMEHCEAEARGQGCSSIELWVQPGNARALGFYQKLGYRRVREEKGNLRLRKAVTR